MDLGIHVCIISSGRSCMQKILGCSTCSEFRLRYPKGKVGRFASVAICRFLVHALEAI